MFYVMEMQDADGFMYSAIDSGALVLGGPHIDSFGNELICLACHEFEEQKLAVRFFLANQKQFKKQNLLKDPMFKPRGERRKASSAEG